MPTYVQLLTLTPEGRANMLRDPDTVLRSQRAIRIPRVVVLGLYAVLGQYDFVNIVDAPDNTTVARFSLEMGVAAGAYVTTLPAIPISRLEQQSGDETAETVSELDLTPSVE